jgi:hypothetical protein
MANRRAERSVAIVLGCNDVGSAVACALHGAGWSVVLVDDADPPWHRRGMAFTNAWYIGNAELDGAGACFCASLKSIPSVLAHGMIAATTWSWGSVADALHAKLLVDAGRSRHRSEVLRGRVPLTIGIGPDHVTGENVDVALEGHDAAKGATPQMQSQSADELAAVWRRRSYVVASTRYGRFMTERRIGESVRAGEKIGSVANETIAAPASGVLLGLAARGARIEPGDELVEVDTNGPAYRCHGIGAGPRSIATSVLDALAGRAVDADAAGAPATASSLSGAVSGVAESRVAPGLATSPPTGLLPTLPAEIVGTLAPPGQAGESSPRRPVIGP